MEHAVVSLKDGSKGTVFFVPGDYKLDVPDEIVDQMCNLFNHIIEEGKTYPHLETFTKVSFIDYWMGKFCAIMVKGEQDKLLSNQTLLGTYYVKPNYIGRCSEVSNAGFLVSPDTRGLGVGKALGKTYLEWGKKLGYRYSVFNLVFETNVASLKIWDSLGFERIGRVPGVANLKGFDKPVSAIIFGKSFV